MHCLNRLKFLSYFIIPLMMSITACGGSSSTTDTTTDTTGITDDSGTDDGTSSDSASTDDTDATDDTATTETAGTESTDAASTSSTTAAATDTDGDGIDDTLDNCVSVANLDQTNTDADTSGDACDTDDDNDGSLDADDCDSTNAAVYPLAAEDCGNGVDDDCDGTIDNPSSFYVDADGDGYGDETATAVTSCTQPTGYVTSNSDCADASSAINPGTSETCNSIDDNCDGTVDEGVTTAYYADSDNDGYGNSALTSQRCSANAIYKVTQTGDCNDRSRNINPAANELCNAIDDDCNGSVDDNPDVGGISYYPDVDGDGWGSSTATATVACSFPTADYSTDHTDCDDNNIDVSPLEPEVCDSLDNNCNGIVDDVTSSTYYADADGDGYGNAHDTQSATCSIPTGYIADATDCDDDNDQLHAGCVDLTDFHSSQTTYDPATTLTNPCGYTGTYHVPVVFTSATEGWVGCANNTSSTYKGVYHTTDGGNSWTKINTTINAYNLKDMTVYDIDTDASGNIYFCGALGSSTTKVYVVKYDGANYTRFSYYGSFGGAKPNECQDIASNDDSELLFTSRGSTSLFFYNGAAWSNLLNSWDGDAAANYSTYDVEALVNDFYVTSSAATDHPYVFTPSTTGTHSYNLTPNVVDSGVYEGLYAIHPVEYNGATRWLAVGEKQIYSTSTAVTSYNDKTGIMYYSDDDGVTWIEASVSVDPSNSNYFANRIWDVSCHATAGVCIATGDIQTWGLDAVSSYPESTRVGGAILMSSDGGATWYQLLDDKMDWDTMETIQGVAWYGDNFFIMSQTAFISGAIE